MSIELEDARLEIKDLNVQITVLLQLLHEAEEEAKYWENELNHSAQTWQSTGSW